MFCHDMVTMNSAGEGVTQDKSNRNLYLDPAIFLCSIHFFVAVSLKCVSIECCSGDNMEKCLL